MPNQNTALHIACENGDFESVKILYKSGLKDFESPNKDKETPLSLAERYQNRGDSYLAIF